MKKFWGIVVAAFLVYFVVTRPASAATVAKGIGTGLAHIANGIAAFGAGLMPS